MPPNCKTATLDFPSEEEAVELVEARACMPVCVPTCVHACVPVCVCVCTHEDTSACSQATHVEISGQLAGVRPLPTILWVPGLELGS